MPNFKQGFGFHPLGAWVDHGADGTGEPLAIMLRPGKRRFQHRGRPPAGLGAGIDAVAVPTGISGRPEIIGPQASTLIQPVIQAMSFGLDARSMARGQYWIHPAMPELIENALLNLTLD